MGLSAPSGNLLMKPHTVWCGQHAGGMGCHPERAWTGLRGETMQVPQGQVQYAASKRTIISFNGYLNTIEFSAQVSKESK